MADHINCQYCGTKIELPEFDVAVPAVCEKCIPKLYAPPPHPWSFIAEELLARGWSAEDLAFRMTLGDEYAKWEKEIQTNVLTLDLYRVVGPTDARCRIGERAGKAMARALDVDDDFILNLERAWVAASGTEARRAETVQHGSVHDGPTRDSGDAQPPAGAK